jgi:hypothetical protein
MTVIFCASQRIYCTAVSHSLDREFLKAPQQSQYSINFTMLRRVILESAEPACQTDV